MSVGGSNLGRSKIEKLGLGKQVLDWKAQGLGSVKIAKKLSVLTGEFYNATNVDNYFKSMQTRISRNKELTEQVKSHLQDANLKILGRWDKIDEQEMKLLDEATKLQKKIIGVDKKTGEPIIIEYKDLRLWKDVVEAISKITETRARVLGQFNTGNTNIYIQNVENQYNDLKQLVVDAEDAFPGIGEWLTNKMLKEKAEETVK